MTVGDGERAYLGNRMATFTPDVFPLVAGAFVGPETIPAALVDERLLDRIRHA